MRRTIRWSSVLVIAAALSLAAVGAGSAKGVSPEQLTAAGWTCFNDPGAPRIVCTDPGHGRPQVRRLRIDPRPTTQDLRAGWIVHRTSISSTPISTRAAVPADGGLYFFSHPSATPGASTSSSRSSVSRGAGRSRSRRRAISAPARRLFPDADDRAVETDRRGPFGESSCLLQLVDLGVARDQNGSRVRLPGQHRLPPDRRIARLAGLGAEHGQLPASRPALHDEHARAPTRAAARAAPGRS